MTKGRRFFIFFSSAGIMTFFLFFTLSARSDKPFEKYMQWTPNQKVLSNILERTNPKNEVFPKRVDLLESTKQKVEKLNVTELEVLHSLREGDVEFFHDLTLPRQKPKQYYILIEIGEIEYFVLTKVHHNYSDIIDFGLVQD